MSHSKAPLVTDMAALIRGASEKPPPIVIGDKQEVVSMDTTKAPKVQKPKKEQGRAPAKESYPWETANPKIIKFVQVRTPEPLLHKLDFIKANTLGNTGRHEIILEILEQAADKMIEEIKKRGYRGG